MAMNKFKEPEPTNWSLADVEEYAADARRKIGYSSGSPMKGVIRYLGGEIAYLHDGFEYSLIVESKDDFLVNLSGHTSVEQDNFTIAVQLGHIALHYDGEPMRVLKRNQDLPVSGQTEREAIRFAAAFLMPGSEFPSVWDQHKGDVGMVAAHYGVSHKVARTRALALGMHGVSARIIT
jgi:Zn-dependent peptidase ImmA (M78 family)